MSKSTFTKEQMRDYQRKWCAERRARYMDGKTCLFCGTDQKIVLHHKDPEKKVASAIWSWKRERILAEMDTGF